MWAGLKCFKYDNNVVEDVPDPVTPTEAHCCSASTEFNTLIRLVWDQQLVHRVEQGLFNDRSMTGQCQWKVRPLESSGPSLTDSGCELSELLTPECVYVNVTINTERKTLTA